jgi:hypothetical protein
VREREREREKESVYERERERERGRKKEIVGARENIETKNQLENLGAYLKEGTSN